MPRDPLDYYKGRAKTPMPNLDERKLSLRDLDTIMTYLFGKTFKKYKKDNKRRYKQFKKK